MTSPGAQLPYFAYGSNMWDVQMEQRCPGSTAIGLARFDGWRFRINQRGVATIVPDVDATVVGVLWDTTAEHIEILDGYEGVAKGNYERTVIGVQPIDNRWADSGPTRDAIVYIACHDRPGPPRNGYLEKVLAGAVGSGLPPATITEIESWREPGRPGGPR